MSQFPWKPLRLIGNLEQQIDQAFEELIHHKLGMSSPSATWQPDIDLYETPEAYLVHADIPGVLPADIRVEVIDHWLTISGSRGSSTIENSAQGVRIERRTGNFSRRFFLERAVDPTRIQREDREGTLQLRLPKCNPQSEPQQPNR